MNKDDLLKAIVAVVLVGLIFLAVFLIMSIGGKDKTEVNLSLDLESDIVSSDPRESAANFILHNGTIGDRESLTEEDILSLNFESSIEKRTNALEIARTAIVQDSPLITGHEEEAILDNAELFAVFYNIDNIEVSKPSEKRKLTINHNEIGPVTYDSVEVEVDFDSIRTVFYWPTDASSDGIIVEEQAIDSFEDIKVIMIESGDLWFIYDVVDSEYILNTRMATWSGRGEPTLLSEQEVVNEYIMDNIY